MKEMDQSAVIAKLQAQLTAKQKTIEALMDAAEERTSMGPLPMDLLSQNLNLERIIEHKTEKLQQQEKELREALHDLQLTQARLLHAQKMESVGQLAAGIAHEINTPAQFISSNIDFLEESFNDVRSLINAFEKVLHAITCNTTIAEISREAKDLLEKLDWSYLDKEIPTAILQSKEGMRRITTIVQAMKEFSHPGSKEKSFYKLNKIIETTITVASNEWKYCAEIETHLDPDLPQVYCLADEIGQALLNILINASHAVAETVGDSTAKGKITISTRQDTDHAEVTIEDTGAGIPENIWERIFDPFFTTKSVGKGTGQGLAISHDVITKKHGGAIRFTSEAGKGTTFVLRLPIKKT